MSSVTEQRPRRTRPASTRGNPCQVCNFPESDRHHLFSVKDYKGIFDHIESAFAYLCPNCHRAYHAMERSHVSQSQADVVNRLARHAWAGGLAGHVLPEICHLLMGAKLSEIRLLNDFIEMPDDGIDNQKFIEMRDTATSIVIACKSMLEKMEGNGLSRRSALSMMLGGAA